MWLTSVSIRRPIFIIMFVLALIVLGWQSRSKMPQELNPKIDFPYVTVLTTYPGAGPNEIETLVSEPIEEAVGSIGNMRNVTSSSQEGVSTVVMEFELGTDLSAAAADVRDKVSAIKGQLPDDIDEPTILKLDIAAEPVMTIGLAGPLSPKEMRILADDTIKDRLAKIGGVASVNVTGGEEREISVAVDKARMQAYGITLSQILGAVRGSNLNLPAGSIKEGSRDYSIRTVGEFKSADELKDVRINVGGKAGNPDFVVRLGDVATIQDTVAEPERLSRINGKPSVVLTIQKQSDANTVAVAEGIKEQLHEMEPVIPAGVKPIITSDTSKFVEDALHDVNKSLFEGILLVVVIVFLFLHTARATFIVAIAIPTSIMATYMPIQAFGFTLNTMTLLALSLVVGILVDDSIVVLENIERHLRMRKSKEEAAIDGRSEIGLAAITITMVDIVVFVPVAFMGGIVGQFFRQFGVTVATATAFSLLMSFTLTPMLASKWMKTEDEKERDDEERERRLAMRNATFKDRIDAVAGWLFGGLERRFSIVDRNYRGLLEWALHNRFLTLVIGFVSLLVVFAMSSPQPSASDWSSGSIALAPRIFLFAATVFALAQAGKSHAGFRSVRGFVFVLVAALVAIAAGALAGQSPNAPKPDAEAMRQNLMTAVLFIGLFSIFLVVAPISRRTKISLIFWPLVAIVGLMGLGSLAKNLQGPAQVVFPRAMIALMAAGLAIAAAFIDSKSRKTALGFGAIMSFLAVTIYLPFGFSMFPQTDQGDFSVNITTPPGTSLAATDQVVRRVEKILNDLPEFEPVSWWVSDRVWYKPGTWSDRHKETQRGYYVSYVGAASAGFFGASIGPQYARVQAKVVDKTHRKRAIEDIVDDIAAKVSHVPGAELITVSASAEHGSNGITKEVQGQNMDAVIRQAHLLKDVIAKTPGAVDVDVSYKESKPERRIVVDRLRAAEYGLSTSQIAMASRGAIAGDDTAKLRDGGTEYPIRIRFGESDRQKSSDVENMIIATKDGAPVYLRDVADVVYDFAPSKIDRKNRQRVVYVTANLAKGFEMGNVSQGIEQALKTMEKVPGVTIDTGGMEKIMYESFGYMFGALGLAILLVYMLMGALFESFLTPFVIMFSLPQAMVGALLAMLITGNIMSIVAMIGIIMLMGLVTKNAILFVDYTNTLRERGRNRHDALLEAGPTRLRPILMTTFAMIGGMTPTALALNQGSEFRAPMAIAVIGGLILSTLLTLIVIPVTYTMVDDIWQWVLRLFGRQPAAALESEEEVAPEPVETY